MCYIGDKNDCSMGYLETIVIVSLLIPILLVTAGSVNALLPNSYFGYLSANAKTESTGDSTHAGAVPLISLNSGNDQLDHQVGQFFKCIKKTGHTGGENGEPSRGEVDTCYDTVFVSGDSGNSNDGNGHAHNHGAIKHTPDQNHGHNSHADIFVS
ncbi:MAG TPA: hypothetical protein VH796_09815 [Nitrososphaeraceae archaeon]|jgi:hypothetical protein